MDLRFFSSVQFAWVVAAILLLAIAVIALGPRFESRERPSYSALSQQRAAEDRSQAPHMLLEAKYPGPLQDTTIERWRDPVDGTICYVYLPVAVPHEPGPNGMVQYGSASLGTISCFPAPAP
jgi:hypothetical protein